MPKIHKMPIISSHCNGGFRELYRSPWCREKKAKCLRKCFPPKQRWQDDLVSVSKFICECMDVMLGADSDDRTQAYDQPQVAGGVAID